MQAVASAFDIKLEPATLAVLCQKVENEIAGAPCGIMDQMTSVCGDADSLLALLCQPAELQTPPPVPGEIDFWGMDSGERHSVGGSDYGSVRTGAFMGYSMISEWAGDSWGGYLANVAPSQFEHEFLERLPEEISGEEFIAQYGTTSDTVTKVDPRRRYKIRHPTAHPVYEHHRVKTFRQLLLVPASEEQRRLMGELMYQSHESYSACGLGSLRTDAIVDLVRSAGAAKGLYGARITGGGSGGTVVILGRADAGPAVAEIAEKYAAISGHAPYVFSGSSSGAAHYRVVTHSRRQLQ
jgi:galactokinase